jgi:hypothetical protein
MSKKLLLFTTLLIFIPLLLSAQEAAKPAVAPAATLSVETAVCTAVTDRAAVGTADNFPPETGKLFLWCKVAGGAAGTAISHVWLHDGKEVAKVELKLGGNPWRTWSSKTFPASWTGNWEVKILGPDGAELKSVTFTVGAAPAKK